METVGCALCRTDDRSSQKVLFWSRDWDDRSLPWQFPVVQCQECGLVFVNPRPDADELMAYYQAVNHVDHRLANQWRVPTERELLRHEWRFEIIRRSTGREKGRILDVGCGDGSFLKLMQMKGWEAHGVEPAEKPARYAATMLDLNVFNGQLLEADFPDGYFDVITFYASFEHIGNPYQVLQECHRVLASRGLLVINVPNIATPAFWLFRRHYSYLQVPLHLYFYNPTTLNLLLSSTGFSPQRIKFSRGYDTLIYSPLLWVQAWEYRLGISRTRGKMLLSAGELGQHMYAALRVDEHSNSWRLKLAGLFKRGILSGFRLLGYAQQRLRIGEVFTTYARKR